MEEIFGRDFRFVLGKDVRPSRLYLSIGKVRRLYMTALNNNDQTVGISLAPDDRFKTRDISQASYLDIGPIQLECIVGTSSIGQSIDFEDDVLGSVMVTAAGPALLALQAGQESRLYFDLASAKLTDRGNIRDCVMCTKWRLVLGEGEARQTVLSVDVTPKDTGN